METLQSAAPVGFAFIDRDFRIVRMNEKLAEVNGSPLQEQIGRTVAEAVPDVWRQMEHVYRGVLETGEAAMNLEVTRQRSGKEGSRFWLASYYPVRAEEEIIGVGVIVTDITERQEAEHFRAAVMNTMVEGLYVLDGEGRLTFITRPRRRSPAGARRSCVGSPCMPRSTLDTPTARRTPRRIASC
jgi:two-component system NtrC family sensor kinase